MTLFWAQVTLILLAIFFHVVGRIYEMKWRQHMHYLDQWEMEVLQAREEAWAWYDAGEYAKAHEALDKARHINRKYTMFFDSIN